MMNKEDKMRMQNSLELPQCFVVFFLIDFYGSSSGPLGFINLALFALPRHY